MRYPKWEELSETDRAQSAPLLIGLSALHNLGYFRKSVRELSPEGRRLYDRLQRQRWARGKRIA